MSTQTKPRPATTPAAVAESDVAHFLREHPVFFERHPEVLASLNLPHGAGTDAVSLIERQVALLRQRNLQLDRKLVDLVDVARSNSVLAEKIHRLALNLIGITDIGDVLAVIEASLREDFGAEESVLVLFGPKLELQPNQRTRFVRECEPDAPALRAFATFIATARPRCGHLRDAQRDFLFGRSHTDEIASAALVPVGERAKTGLLAVGSSDSNHFNPTMGTDYLMRIGELIDRAVGQCAGA